RPRPARKPSPTSPSSRGFRDMRTSNILTIGGAFVAILGGAFSLLMVKAFVSDKGQGFVDLSGLVVGGIVLAVGLALIAVGRKRARVEAGNAQGHCPVQA